MLEHNRCRGAGSSAGQIDGGSPSAVRSFQIAHIIGESLDVRHVLIEVYTGLCADSPVDEMLTASVLWPDGLVEHCRQLMGEPCRLLLTFKQAGARNALTADVWCTSVHQILLGGPLPGPLSEEAGRGGGFGAVADGRYVGLRVAAECVGRDYSQVAILFTQQGALAKDGNDGWYV
jgi:hypothetical protein